MIAADVYAVSPHTGRGGWTWYTGSAGWTYRLIVESLLGLKLEVNRLRITPCFPPDWKSFQVHYRYGGFVKKKRFPEADPAPGPSGSIWKGVEKPELPFPFKNNGQKPPP